ncbi:unnamed protein product [Chrysodeixis includens]|uniref:Cyclin N-terminal domain-containing protein n=1 Tax=Chrysodeixis includens TaxID=689277 RepID=A0A9P0BJ65_CHRIL|nr:unnamed protein product [Chrysodeixis includens]
MWVVKNLLLVRVIKGRRSFTLLFYKMDQNGEEITFAAEFVENLVQDYENEARVEAAWPILVMNAGIRTQVWNICESIGQSSRGVPATACRLLERFLSTSTQKYLSEQRDSASWERYKITLGTQIYLSIVACIQLVAKNCDRVSHVPASVMRAVLMKAGIQHTKAEILAMEIKVFKTLDFRLPTWSTLETAEFLATLLGLNKDAKVKSTLTPILDLTEYHRDVLEYHIKAWDEATNTPGSSSSKPGVVSVHNLHISAGAVCAAARHAPPRARRAPRNTCDTCDPREPGDTCGPGGSDGEPDAPQRLATILRAEVAYLRAITDVIVKRILPQRKKPTPNHLKRKR